MIFLLSICKSKWKSCMKKVRKLTLTAQQMLMSPGDFWLGLKTKSKRSGVIFLLLMAMIVGEIDNVVFASEDYKAEVPVAQYYNRETFRCYYERY